MRCAVDREVGSSGDVLGCRVGPAKASMIRVMRSTIDAGGSDAWLAVTSAQLRTLITPPVAEGILAQNLSGNRPFEKAPSRHNFPEISAL